MEKDRIMSTNIHFTLSLSSLLVFFCNETEFFPSKQQSDFRSFCVCNRPWKKRNVRYCNWWFAFLQLRAAFKALIFITNLYSFDLQWIYSVNMYKLMFKLKTTLVPHTHTLFLTMEEKLAKMMKYLSHRERIPSPKKTTFNINKRWDGNTNASEWKVSDVKLNSLVFLPNLTDTATSIAVDTSSVFLPSSSLQKLS